MRELDVLLQSAVRPMIESVQQALESTTPSMLMLPAGAAVGAFAAASSCCNVAVVGAIAGYSGSLSRAQRQKDILFAGAAWSVPSSLLRFSVPP